MNLKHMFTQKLADTYLWKHYNTQQIGILAECQNSYLAYVSFVQALKK